MSGPYNGHILEFPQIRVDCFTAPHPQSPWLLPDPYDPTAPPRPAPPAQLYLLTHVHTDHLVGLSNDFTGHIICSADTKRLIPQLEAEVERGRLSEGVREVPRKKYDRLKPKVLDKGAVVDRLEALPYGVTKTFNLGYEHGKPIEINITLFEANHCPGSTMFLITSNTRAVLHTGDIRADSLFLQTLRRNPSLGEYIAPLTHHKADNGRRTLDRIYLDTGAVLGTGDMPDREVVLRDLLSQMELYPPDTIFFLNVWCLGWEDVIKEIARHFNTRILVDRYKSALFKAIHDPYLSACVTLDPGTRFHACERTARCVDCRKSNTGRNDKLIVNVIMIEVKQASWDLEHRDFLDQLGKAALGESPWPCQIQCPIARHSPLPELQSLVKLFRPNALTPNTIAKELKGIDYYTLPELFHDCLSPEAYHQTVLERDQWFVRQKQYGPAFLHSMRTRSIASNTLNTPPRVGPVGRNRAAHRRDQLLRAGLDPHNSRAIAHQIPARPTRPVKQETTPSRASSRGDDDPKVKRTRRRTADPSHLASTASLSAKDTKPQIAPTFSRKSFLLDKEHLRALAMVTAEVDDL